MKGPARDGSRRRDAVGGRRDSIGLTGVCTIFAGAYLAKRDRYEAIVAEAEWAHRPHATTAPAGPRRVGVAGLRRVVDAALARRRLPVRPASDATVWGRR